MSQFQFHKWFIRKLLSTIAVAALLVSFTRILRDRLELRWKGYAGPFRIQVVDLPQLLISHKLIVQVVRGDLYGKIAERHISGARTIIEHTAYWRRDGSLAETVVATRPFCRGLQLKFLDGMLTDLEQLGDPRVPIIVDELGEWEEDRVYTFMDLLHEKSPIPERPRRSSYREASYV